MATEQAAAASTATTTPAAATTEGPAAATTTEAAPAAQAAPTMADDLRAAIAEHAAELDAMGGKPKELDKPADGDAKPDAAAAPDKKPDADKPAEGEKKDGEAKPEDKPAEEKPKDEVAETVAKYLRQHERAVAREKEAKDRTAALEKDRADFAKQQEAFAQTQTTVNRLVQLVQTKPVEAIEFLLGSQALRDENSTIITDLIDHVAKLRGGASPVAAQSEEERIAAKVREGIEADRKAREDAEKAAKDKAESDRKTNRSQAFASYITGLAEEFNANADKYPFLQAQPIVKAEFSQIDEFLQSYFNQNARLATGKEVLSHFEKLRETVALRHAEVLRKTGRISADIVQPAATAKPGAKTTSPAIGTNSVDARGVSAAPNGYERSLEDERDEIARNLDKTVRW